MFFLGCEKLKPQAEINRLIKQNDLSMEMKAAGEGYTIREADGEDGEYIEIDVQDEFSLRGEAGIQPGRIYRLSITMKNESADPLVSYSFWTDSMTMTRHYTLAGENDSPPVSATQELSSGWVMFAETFEAHKDEKSFLMTLHCEEGIFCIKELSIEEI